MLKAALYPDALWPWRRGIFLRVDMAKDGDRIPLDKIEAQVRWYLSQESLRYIECAINLAVTTLPPDEVAEYLRTQADLLEEYR